MNYIKTGDDTIVRNLFPISDIPEMYRFISRATGTDISDADDVAATKLNQSVMNRSTFIKGFIDKIRPLSNGILQNRIPEPVKRVVRQYVYAPVNKTAIWDNLSGDVKDFVTGYYSDDKDIYENALKSRASVDTGHLNPIS